MNSKTVRIQWSKVLGETMANESVKQSRLARLYKRQRDDAWGKDYVAGIWSTPKEAPKSSVASILAPAKLGLRDFHALSQNETWAALLALYHPNTWDVHEQRILYPEPRPHFLHGHPLAAGMTFQPFKGTLDVANRHGMLSKHPKCSVTLKNSRERAIVPYPYTGDLLLFLLDKNGPYVVNWTVKDKAEAFRQRGPRKGKPSINEDHQATIMRHVIEEEYYRDAGIPTRQIVGRSIDLELRANLNELFLAHAITVPFTAEEKSQIWQFMRDHIGTTKKAYLVVREIANELQQDFMTVKNVLLQGIWQRHIRIDLFRPFLMDRPLRAEVRDPIDVYRDWFVRG